MTQKYFKYRYNHFNMGQWDYSISYIYNQNRAWYVDNGIVAIKDLIIHDDKYLDGSKGKRFGIIEYDESKVSSADIDFDMNNDYSQFSYKTMNAEEADYFLDTFTSLTKDSNWYLVSEWGIDINGETVPPVYIKIV